MFVKTWRFLTVLLTALTMGMLFCHALEMIPKMQYDGALYVTIQNTLYRFFGPPVGGFIEMGALLGSLVLTVLVRKRRPAFYWTLAATICLAAALAIYFLFTEPVNVVIEQATATSLPANWQQLRVQWEYSHLTDFVLYLLGFIALLISVLAETAERNPITVRAEQPRETLPGEGSRKMAWGKK